MNKVWINTIPSRSDNLFKVKNKAIFKLID